MKNNMLIQLGAQAQKAGVDPGAVPVWRAAFEKDLTQRLKKMGQGGYTIAPSPMTMAVARIAQHYAMAGDYDQVLAAASALARDPGTPLLLRGDEVQRVVAQGLLGMAMRIAKDKECSVGVQKTILLLVLDTYYSAGQRDSLIAVAIKGSTPSALAFSAAALFSVHKDREALEADAGHRT